MTKLDVLSGQEKIKIGVAYEFGGEIHNDYTFNSKVFSNCSVVYEEMAGWCDDIGRVKEYRHLPANAKKYIERIEQLIEVPISKISVGSSREQTISK